MHASLQYLDSIKESSPYCEPPRCNDCGVIVCHGGVSPDGLVHQVAIPLPLCVLQDATQCFLSRFKQMVSAHAEFCQNPQDTALHEPFFMFLGYLFAGILVRMHLLA
jgi:hypothetical protein